MNNAQAVFETLDRFTKIQDLLGKQEDIFLDFKEREHGWNSQDKMSDNEKRLFSRAASGFAHQEGGVLVWGIEAKKDSSGVDQAYALKPFGKFETSQTGTRRPWRNYAAGTHRGSEFFTG